MSEKRFIVLLFKGCFILFKKGFSYLVFLPKIVFMLFVLFCFFFGYIVHCSVCHLISFVFVDM